MSLELWATPFAREKWPSVVLIPESRGIATATILVAPGGIAAYPKYLIWFSAVYSFAAEEEAGGLSVYDGRVHGFPSADGCAFIWNGSPQAAAYSTLHPKPATRGGRGPMVHYLLFGGDSNVGVVSAEQPEIERLDGPRSIVVAHEA